MTRPPPFGELQPRAADVIKTPRSFLIVCGGEQTEPNYSPGGMVFAGAPNEVAERILHLHELLGHSRQILQMDVGGMPHRDYLRSIELLGTRVLPQVRAALTAPETSARTSPRTPPMP